MHAAEVERVRRALSEFDYVQFTFCDINGYSRGKMQPVRYADDFQKGLATFNGKARSVTI